jgi:hypothetical protein
VKPAFNWVAHHAGVLLVVGGAVVLLVSLWLPWFSVSPVCAQELGVPCPRAVRFSAWESFRIADVMLAALAGVAILGALAGPGVATRLAPVLGLEPVVARALARLGVAATGWVAVCLSLYAVDRPSLAVVPGYVTDAGYLTALLAGGAIVGGGWWELWMSSRRP